MRGPFPSLRRTAHSPNSKTHHFHLTRNGVKEATPQKRQGFTTMVDLAEFEKTTWAFLVNIKMTWQYDGMAYLFREAGIPL